MDVTLLYFDDCPSWQQAEAHLQVLAGEMPDLVVHRQLVETADAAEQHDFRGSPSIHVDGVDLFADVADPVGMCCRVYQTPAGLAGSPTLDQVRAALTASSEQRQRPDDGSSGGPLRREQAQSSHHSTT